MFGFERHSRPSTFLNAKRKLIDNSYVKLYYANLANYAIPRQYGSESAAYTNIDAICAVFPWRRKNIDCLLWKETLVRLPGNSPQKESVKYSFGFVSLISAFISFWTNSRLNVDLGRSCNVTLMSSANIVRTGNQSSSSLILLSVGN